MQVLAKKKPETSIFPELYISSSQGLLKFCLNIQFMINIWRINFYVTVIIEVLHAYIY